MIIRSLQKSDLKSVKMYTDYVNALIDDKEPIILNEKITVKQEISYLKEQLKNIEKHKEIYLVAMDKKLLAGIIHISLKEGKQNHIGELGMSVKKEYRGKGLGNRLMQEAIEKTKELKPIPSILRLSVFSSNSAAIALYRKFEFYTAAILWRQIKTENGLEDEIIMLMKI